MKNLNIDIYICLRKKLFMKLKYVDGVVYDTQLTAP